MNFERRYKVCHNDKPKQNMKESQASFGTFDIIFYEKGYILVPLQFLQNSSLNKAFQTLDRQPRMVFCSRYLAPISPQTTAHKCQSMNKIFKTRTKTFCAHKMQHDLRLSHFSILHPQTVCLSISKILVKEHAFMFGYDFRC